MSTKSSTIIAIAILTPALIHSENLFRNSDISSTAAWRGDKAYTEIDSNRVIELKANPHKEEVFYQGAKTRRIKDVVLKFRYMSRDYKGRGLQLRGERPDGSATFKNTTITVDGQWHEYSWRFSEIRDSVSINFLFKLLEGEGMVYFDDITLETQK